MRKLVAFIPTEGLTKKQMHQRVDQTFQNSRKPNSVDILGFILGALILGIFVSGIGSTLLAGKQSKPPAVVEKSSAPSPTESPTPSPSPTPEPPSPSIPWGSHVKLNDKATFGYYGADERMATADELFVAVNNFRQVYGLSTLQKSDILCNVAQTRANDLQSLGKLDDHQGFTRFYYDPTVSQAFWHIGEVLAGGQPNLAVHIVEWGWAQSLTGHREELLKTIWTDGCGGVSGYFAVFVFGARR